MQDDRHFEGFRIAFNVIAVHTFSKDCYAN